MNYWFQVGASRSLSLYLSPSLPRSAVQFNHYEESHQTLGRSGRPDVDLANNEASE